MQMNHRATTTTKPYCRACHNAGKPIDEYTSHWTRSSPGSGGVITCPLILSSECGYCHQTGHWTKFCPVLAGKGADEEGAGCEGEADEEGACGEVEVEEDGSDDVASIDSGTSKSKKVLNWKSALGMKGAEAEVEAEVEAGEKSKKVLNWKKALGMGETFPSLSQKSKTSTPNLGVGVGGVAVPALTSWVSVVSLLPPPPPTSTSKMSKEEFKRIFCNFKRYENWADADSDLDNDDDLPVGSLAV